MNPALEPTIATFEITAEDGQLVEAEITITPNPEPLPNNPDPPEAA